MDKRFDNTTWREKMEIKLDVNNMFSDKIGEKHGIKRAIVDEHQEKIHELHQAIKEQEKEGKMGFMELPFQDRKIIEKIKEVAKKLEGNIENFVVLGIGGSALGSIALKTALKDPYLDLKSEVPKLFIPDNVDPVRFKKLLERLNLEKTVFNIISKSGGTAETMSLFLIARKAVKKEVADANLADHFIATTSEKTGYLIKIAEREGLTTFNIPDNVGGRFSVLSPVGLLFAATAGIDIEELLAGARYMYHKCDNGNLWKNPAYLMGLLQYLAYQDGKKMSVMMPYSHQLKDIADWYRQLWAESLGKELDRDGNTVNVGPTPIQALGATDQHSQSQLYMEGPYDKIINFIEVKQFEERVEIPEAYSDIEGVSYLGGHSLNKLIKTEKKATELALTNRNRMNNSIILPEINEFTLGQLFYYLELQTALIGELFNINAFNQPGVELSKNYTYGILGRKGYEEMKIEYENKPQKSEDLIL
ncbi:MAG: glucose-6-phosphate isomerase [Bacillota bacterium]